MKTLLQQGYAAVVQEVRLELYVLLAAPSLPYPAPSSLHHWQIGWMWSIYVEMLAVIPQLIYLTKKGAIEKYMLAYLFLQ